MDVESLFKKELSQVLRSNRLVKLLHARSINTLDELMIKIFKSGKSPQHFLLCLNGFGNKSFKDFECALKENNLNFNDLILKEGIKKRIKFESYLNILEKSYKKIDDFSYKIRSLDYQLKQLNEKLNSCVSVYESKEMIRKLNSEVYEVAIKITNDFNNQILKLTKDLAITEHRIKELNK